MEVGVDVCDGCGARIAGGVTGCAALMHELTARSADARRLIVRRTFVDAYALQHVATQCPAAETRVSHLLSLCCTVEYDGSLQIYSGMKAWLRRATPVPLLEPPGRTAEATISGPAAAEDLDEYIDAVRGWGRHVWEAWSIHHDLVRSWIGEIRSTR